MLACPLNQPNTARRIGAQQGRFAFLLSYVWQHLREMSALCRVSSHIRTRRRYTARRYWSHHIRSEQFFSFSKHDFKIATSVPKVHCSLSFSEIQVSAAIAGLAAGALIFVPLGQIFGRSSIAFWSLVCSLACAIWSSQMTDKNDYVRFIISRLLSGMFGSVPSAVGGGIILDVFFLHDRGKAFICYEVSILLGAAVGPTFSGFISNSQQWTICFWWTVPLLAISAIAVLLLAEETGYDRQKGTTPVKLPQRYIANRVATFFPGAAVVSKPSAAEFVSIAYVVG